MLAEAEEALERERAEKEESSREHARAPGRRDQPPDDQRADSATRRGPQARHEAAAANALLRADEVVAGYVPGVNILNGCDLYVNDGELVGIIGPNGAGKSTLLKAIFGLVKVSSGTITLRGEDITGLKANQLVAKGVGFVPQTNNVFPSLTIEENLQMGVYQAPKKFKQRFEFVTGLFPALGDRRAQRAGSLSGGERQMVAMGRALMMEPSVLLLDEPSAGLSPALQDEVFVRTRQINRAGVSVIMVEQNARRCLQICDRGYVLDQGRNAYTASRPGPAATTRRSSSCTSAPSPRPDRGPARPPQTCSTRGAGLSGVQQRARVPTGTLGAGGDGPGTRPAGRTTGTTEGPGTVTVPGPSRLRAQLRSEPILGEDQIWPSLASTKV